MEYISLRRYDIPEACGSYQDFLLRICLCYLVSIWPVTVIMAPIISEEPSYEDNELKK
jgi:hypothetical protein